MQCCRSTIAPVCFDCDLIWCVRRSAQNQHRHRPSAVEHRPRREQSLNACLTIESWFSLLLWLKHWKGFIISDPNAPSCQLTDRLLSYFSNRTFRLLNITCIMLPFICSVAYVHLLWPRTSLQVSLFSSFEDELWHVRNSYQRVCTMQNISHRGGKKLKERALGDSERRAGNTRHRQNRVVDMIFIVVSVWFQIIF